MQNKSYDSAKLSPLSGSRIEITGSILPDVLETYRAKALKSVNDSVTIDGFRKGMVPENILIAKVGEPAILEEMAELALSRAYVDIVIDNKIDAVGKPQVTITKLAKGNPLEFKAVTAVVPAVKLPDYKKLASEAIKRSDPKESEVTDKDVEDAILRVRKAHASHEGHDHSKMSPEEHEAAILASLPEFNDDFVRGLGSDFTDVEDFKKKVRIMIGENKKDEAKEKARIRIADALVENTKIELPEVMIESELNRTQAQFETDIERMGVKLEDYLKHAKKSLEDIRKEWRPIAEKKAKIQLILNAIAAAEDLKPDQKAIDAEVEHIVSHYKDADREHAAVYAETVLTNEQVFQFLEK
ncbi:MAG: hypothetical protein KGI45_00540 [Patescibacteria group bacterium]|nr:hypothetical protein [Patescibacteria group bacterium]MDE1966552.1 hypothetical protein [Patescibacteria group bacterium]